MKAKEFDQLMNRGAAGFLATCNYGGIVIVIDDSGEGVLWRKDFGDWKHTAQRWQPIKWTAPRSEDQEARPYFTIYGRRYYLDQFMRCA